MDLEEFFEPTLHIVLGKGGVGKTTVSAVLATASTRLERDALICETEGKGGLSAVFGRGALSFREDELSERVWARTIRPDDALLEYLADHGMTRFSKFLARTNVLEYVATAIPGIKDVLVLGKIKQLVKGSRENERRYGTVVVDAPAAGHALTFLTSATGIVNAVRVGPIRDQAVDVLDLLEDTSSTVVHIVTIPEETPVNEAIETAEALRERVGCRLGVVFINSCYPKPIDLPDIDELRRSSQELGVEMERDLAEALQTSSRFLADRWSLQRRQIDRLGALLDLPRIELPFLFSTDFGSSEIGELADAACEGISRLESGGEE